MAAAAARCLSVWFAAACLLSYCALGMVIILVLLTRSTTPNPIATPNTNKTEGEPRTLGGVAAAEWAGEFALSPQWAGNYVAASPAVLAASHTKRQARANRRAPRGAAGLMAAGGAGGGAISMVPLPLSTAPGGGGGGGAAAAPPPPGLAAPARLPPQVPPPAPAGGGAAPPRERDAIL